MDSSGVTVNSRGGGGIHGGEFGDDWNSVAQKVKGK